MAVNKKLLFVNREGTLISRPANGRVDRFEKLRLVTDCINCLKRLADHGFQLLMFSTQVGLGSDEFPHSSFDGPHQLLLEIFRSQGVTFEAVAISGCQANDQSQHPHLGLIVDQLKTGECDLANCYVVSDLEEDLSLADEMGIQGLKLGDDVTPGWQHVCERILTRPRRAHVERTTNETQIVVSVNLDKNGFQSDPGQASIATGIGFFDHMLEQLSNHAGIGMTVACQGDLHIDLHHSVEDVALAIGSTIDQALGDRRGIGRYGFLLAMDESQANVAVDLSGRPVYVQNGHFTTDRIGDFPTEMVSHFFQSLSQTLRAAIHVEFRGENNHHMAEAIFKGVGRALRPALARAGSDLPSTKGVL